MKTFKLVGIALVAILLSVNFTSCSKDDGPTEEIATPETTPAIVEWSAKDITDISYEGYENSIHFRTNYNWKAEITYSSSSNNNWCTISPSNGSKNDQYFKIKISKNLTYDNRSATISFVCNNEKKSFRLVQKGSPKPTTIKVEKAGELKNKLNNINNSLISLIIEGEINGDDIAALRNFYSSSYALKSLDLSKIKIVKGGSFEYKQDYGFAGTQWLTQECQQDNVIPNNMFNNGFRGLEEIVLPDSATSIGHNALENCVGLKKVKLPSNVITIGSSAFKNCSDLEDIELPKTVTTIGSSAFFQCNTIKSIIIPEGVTKIDNGTFYWCRNLANVKLPESLTEIGVNAFFECSYKLTQITIPKNVKKIGYQAFYKCNKLTSVICLAETAPTIKHTFSDNTTSYAFEDNYRGNLAVPKSCSSSYRSSDWNIFFSITELNN